MSHDGGFVVFTVCSSFMLKCWIWLTAQINNVAFSSFSFGDNLLIFWKNVTNTPYFLLQPLLHQFANLLSVRPSVHHVIGLLWVCGVSCTHARCLAVSTRPTRSPQLCARALQDRHRRNQNQEPRRRRRRAEGERSGWRGTHWRMHRNCADTIVWTKVSMMETVRLLRGKFCLLR